MPLVSKTVEVEAPAETIMAIVADFESYPEWNEEIKGCWVLARYDDGRPSQLRLDVVVQGQSGSFITAVYYPSPNEIYTVLQQGDHFDKQEQKFSVVPIGPTALLTVDLDVETKLPIPKAMVKKAIGDTLDYLAGNLKARAEQLAAGIGITLRVARPRRRLSAFCSEGRRFVPQRQVSLVDVMLGRPGHLAGTIEPTTQPSNPVPPHLPAERIRHDLRRVARVCRNPGTRGSRSGRGSWIYRGAPIHGEHIAKFCAPKHSCVRHEATVASAADTLGRPQCFVRAYAHRAAKGWS